MTAFEIWDDPSGIVRFCFSHTDEHQTSGVMILAPHTELPQHNRPLAFENLLQVSGTCSMRLVEESGHLQTEYELKPGAGLRMEKGQWHIHANASDEPSVTMFKAEGNIEEVMAKLRQTFVAVNVKDVTHG